MQPIAGYVAALIVFILVDGIWLSVMGKLLYRPILGDILLANLRIAPAIVFYAMFPVGIVTFAVVPGPLSGRSSTAVCGRGGISFATLHSGFCSTSTRSTN